MKNLDTAFCDETLALLDAAMLKIEHCVGQLSDAQIWWRPFEGGNSIGNLLLHISGNLRQWGIVPITKEADQRDRENEFSAEQAIGRDELMTLVRQTVTQAKNTISGLDEVALLEFKTIQGFSVTQLAAVIHTTTHFVGHTHQIILLARLQLGGKYQFQWSVDGDRGILPI